MDILNNRHPFQLQFVLWKRQMYPSNFSLAPGSQWVCDSDRMGAWAPVGFLCELLSTRTEFQQWESFKFPFLKFALKTTIFWQIVQ